MSFTFASCVSVPPFPGVTRPAPRAGVRLDHPLVQLPLQTIFHVTVGKAEVIPAAMLQTVNSPGDSIQRLGLGDADVRGALIELPAVVANQKHASRHARQPRR